MLLCKNPTSAVVACSYQSICVVPRYQRVLNYMAKFTGPPLATLRNLFYEEGEQKWAQPTKKATS